MENAPMNESAEIYACQPKKQVVCFLTVEFWEFFIYPLWRYIQAFCWICDLLIFFSNL